MLETSENHSGAETIPARGPKLGFTFDDQRSARSDWSMDAPSLDDYEIMGRIGGHSGQGTVWRARHRGTDKVVAIKFLRPESLGSPEAQARFRLEVQLTAKLEHPNICQIYETGLHRGAYYYAMQWVDGVTMDEYVGRGNLSMASRLGLLGQVCEAVQYAHERGIIHRDLKPANIVVSSDGRPHILDFGVAKALGADGPSNRASDDGLVGTIPWMSPEQAAGKEVSTRSDLYSLGVILYFLLTGAMPREMGQDFQENLRRVAEEPVRPPRAVCRDLHRELEAILGKALAHQPSQRYGSAKALADDIGNHLSGNRPVEAMPRTQGYVLRKWSRRHWKVLTVGGLLFLMLVGVVVAVGMANVEIRKQKERADDQREQAVRSAYLASTQRRLALEALNSLIYEVQRELSGDLGRLRLRKALLDIALRVLDQIQDSSDSYGVPVDRDWANAQVLIGDIYGAAGEAGKAVDAYGQGVRMLGELADREPQNTTLMHDLCVAHVRLGQARLRQGRPDEAEEQLQAAFQAAQRRAGRQPNDPTLLRDEWAVRVSLGDLALARGQSLQAAEHFQAALAAARPVPGQEADVQSRRDEALVLTRLGDSELRRGEPARAGEFYGKALEIDRRRAAMPEASLVDQRDLGIVLSKSAEAAMDRRDGEEAERLARQAVETLERVLQSEPDRAGTIGDLAGALFVSAETLRRGGKPGEADGRYRRAADLLQPLARQGVLDSEPSLKGLLSKIEDAWRTPGPALPGGLGTSRPVTQPTSGG